MAESADIQVNRLITYSSDLAAPITPLTIVNKSDHYYIFKIRSNQKNAISLTLINGFLRPASVIQISIKLLEKPSATIPLKLEINYAIATIEEFAKNDPKGTIATKELTKEIIMIVPELASSRSKVKTDDGGSETDRNKQSESKIMMETMTERNSIQQASSIKETNKEEDADVFKTAEIDPFPVTSSPSLKKEESDGGTHFPGALFKHTFSTEKINLDETPNDPFKNLISLDMFEKPGPEPDDFTSEKKIPAKPTKEEILNPFDILLLKQAKPVQLEELPLAPQQTQQPQPQQSQQQELHIKITSSEKQQMLVSGDQGQDNEKEDQLLVITTKVQCQKQFIEQLRWIPAVKHAKKFSKLTFFLAFLLCFALGASAKRFLF